MVVEPEYYIEDVRMSYATRWRKNGYLACITLGIIIGNSTHIEVWVENGNTSH